jgi:glycerol-3-phosphate O-acyltransferase/dihydroxyacetone phosphate acyltransferase
VVTFLLLTCLSSQAGILVGQAVGKGTLVCRRRCALLNGPLSQFILHIFFSRIEVVGKHHLEKVGRGPVIFVGNHANQFLDPAILVATVNRPVGFLVAAVSMTRFLIGHAARLLNSIPVVRSQDLARVASGSITSDGLRVTGVDTHFSKDVEAGASLKVSGQQTTPTVAKVISDTELELKFPFDLPVDSAKFKVWPKLDHAQVYEKVFERLHRDGAIGIFPEGGSHDNPHLIPLKAGVTLMALGAMDKYSSLKVKIVPCGLNYFHGHRFRSHVMVEYGAPIEIPWQLVLEYRKNKRETCDKLLLLIESRLRGVTLNYPSFQAMELVTLARRLYQPDVELSADKFIQLQRRFALFFVLLRDRPEVVEALAQVEEYDAALKAHGLKDYEIQSMQPQDTFMYFTLLLRAAVLLVIVLLSIPGAVLNIPMGLISRVLARREAKKALAKSEVKVKAQDVIASYKVIVAMVIVPVAWTLYFLIFSFFYGLQKGFLFLLALPWFSYAAIRMLEQGLQIWRSSIPLLRSLWRARFVETVTELKTHRRELVKMMRTLVKTMEPLLGKEFQDERIITPDMLADADEEREGARKSSVIGVNRRTYKEKTDDAVADSFMDFASDFDSARKPAIFGTSVEMERLAIWKKAEEEEKSPRESRSPRIIVKR